MDMSELITIRKKRPSVQDESFVVQLSRKSTMWLRKPATLKDYYDSIKPVAAFRLRLGKVNSSL